MTDPQWNLNDSIDRQLLSRSKIAARVRELALQIAEDLRRESAGDEPQVTLLGVMTGSLIFLSDLIRDMPMIMKLRLVTISSYPGTSTQSQGPMIHGDLPPLAGQHVLIVDDILDSGRTLKLLQSLVAAHEPKSVRTCVFLRKQRAEPPVAEAQYVGFEIPDLFVVGYGLDYDDHYRNLPYVATLKSRVLEP